MVLAMLAAAAIERDCRHRARLAERRRATPSVGMALTQVRFGHGAAGCPGFLACRTAVSCLLAVISQPVGYSREEASSLSASPVTASAGSVPSMSLVVRRERPGRFTDIISRHPSPAPTEIITSGLEVDD
jgi:hypothetical protein